MRLNPSTPDWAFVNYGVAYFMAGRYEDALRMQDHIPREGFSSETYFLRAGSLAALGRTEEARAVVAETLARFPRVTVEWGAWWIGYTDADWQRLVETLRKAGFPLCASKEDLATMTDVKRLPECEAERAKATAAAKAG